jgi:hypothetical protein
VARSLAGMKIATLLGAFGKWMQEEAQQDMLLLAESNVIKRKRRRWS